MASFSQLFVVIAIAAALLPSSIATQYIVGDNNGWTFNFNYTVWAKDKVFNQGDTLVFNYPVGKHNVAKVDAVSFANCTVPANGVVLTSGNDVVTLKTPGKKWYICSVADHCLAKMQKLVINVLPLESAPAPAPYSIPPPPSHAAGSEASIRFVAMTVMMVVLVISLA